MTLSTRPATALDLPALEAMYEGIVAAMDAAGICIWDEVYPTALFADDIARGELYVVEDDGQLAAAFALCAENEGPEHVPWQDAQAPAAYLGRLGVHARRMHEGIGAYAVEQARTLACTHGAAFLRLFVVDCNEPALRLYEKLGFVRADGAYDNVIEPGFALREYGLEIPTT
ncbi:GNAT family N-acetyltransferase [Eggerthella sinensis]|uniref:GNAT family N-acetyltransferase n=1 Tax=Eggerthella sinensis TaxID=242230 RepID=UPI001D05FF45|nr:GNAT family N-acetyltransferase [Eggerthella sinensis]MCB7038764.1 GNAT family N-acetyltransferase [Eggerthella sinensis]